MLEEELQGARHNSGKLTLTNDVLLKNNIELETVKIKLEDSHEGLNAKNVELTEENEDLLCKY